MMHFSSRVITCSTSSSNDRKYASSKIHLSIPPISADDDSDSSPHDLEGGNRDLEYGTVLLNLNNHQSFTQMQVC